MQVYILCNMVHYMSFLVWSMISSDGHREDVAMDDVIMDADMFGLGETWLGEDNEVNLNNVFKL